MQMITTQTEVYERLVRVAYRPWWQSAWLQYRHWLVCLRMAAVHRRLEWLQEHDPFNVQRSRRLARRLTRLARELSGIKDRLCGGEK